MTKKGETGIYELEGGRKRAAFAFRAYVRHYTETVKAIAVEVLEEEDPEEPGKILRKKVEHEIDKTVEKSVELVDVVVLLLPEDERKGATRGQVLRGFFVCEAVQVGEGVDRFNAAAG